MKKAILLIGLMVLIVVLSGCTQSTGQASLSSTQTKTDCPYECCKDASQYFGKVCALDAECVDNECVNVEESGVQEQSEESTEGGQEHVAAIVESDTSQPAQQQEQLACPSSCNDGNPCTDDYCNESTNYLCSNNILNGEAIGCSGSAGTCKINSCVNGTCQQQTQTNCCGNSQCEVLESHLSCPVDCECTPDWQCTSWSTCNGGVKTRTCYDYSYCETTQDKPAESQSCTMSITEKIRECARKCSGADADIPAVYYEFYEVCYELYYYVGMGEMENFMKDC